MTTHNSQNSQPGAGTVNGIITQMVACHVDFDIWTGQIRFESEDYALLNSGINVTLPNSDQGTLGNKRLVDPNHLKPFHCCKNQLVAYLQEKGLPFVGGYLVAAKDVAQVRSRIEAAEKEFNRLVEDFTDNYRSYREDWTKQNPQLTYASAPPQGSIGERFRFVSHLYKMTGVAELGEEESLQELEVCIRSNFYSDIAKRAKDMFYRFVFSRPYGVPELYNGMDKLRDKCVSLGFLNPEVKKIVDLLDSLLFNAEPDKTLKGKAFVDAASALMLLSDTTDLLRYLDGKCAATVYEGIVSNTIQLAQDVYEDLRNRDTKGRKITPALVARILAGKAQMPTTPATVAPKKHKAARKPAKAAIASASASPKAKPENAATDATLTLPAMTLPPETQSAKASKAPVKPVNSVKPKPDAAPVDPMAFLNQMLGI